MGGGGVGLENNCNNKTVSKMTKTQSRATAEEPRGWRGLMYKNLKSCVDTESRQRERRRKSRIL